MKSLFKLLEAKRLTVCFLCTVGFAAPAFSQIATETQASSLTQADAEPYREVPMPPGFRVVSTELEGPVFATAEGKTLYHWPQHKLRNGYSGEAAGKPACFNRQQTVTAGLMSPYPPGIELPDLDTRPTCTDIWPPVVAGVQAEEVGDWLPLQRSDGVRQWMYKEQPLYTYTRDRKAGDTLGGSTRKRQGDSPASRSPVGPPAKIPPGFAVKTTLRGRLLTTSADRSVYAFDQDTPEASACREVCLRDWRPLRAPELAKPRPPWSVLERSAGVKQWVFRGQPLYAYRRDSISWSQEGSDVAGWRNVFTQMAPAYPEDFTIQDTLAGEVLADGSGKTIYLYQCGEDSLDQLGCDHPGDTQTYRLAMCGAGDPERCLSYWPYVQAPSGARAPSNAWSVVSIDAATGQRLLDRSTQGLRVWAFRDRPVYTFAGDKQAGEVNGGGTGEWRGKRNGLLAFWLRDDYLEGGL